MDESGARGFFDDIAARWDTVRESMFGEEVREAGLRAAAIERGMRVADVGCGTGFLAQGAARAGARVVGVDESGPMLAQACLNLADAAFLPVQAKAERLPLADASLDVVMANMVLHHAPDPAQTIHEMCRVLRRGGRLVVTDVDRHDHEWLREAHHDVWLGFERPVVRRWLEEAGLTLVSVEDTGQMCCASSCAAAAVISVFVARGDKP